MKYHKQLFRHDPAKGSHGDCQRTCIACLLDKDLDEVPNFGIHYDDTDKFQEMLDTYLASVGYLVVQLHFTGDVSPQEILTYVGTNNARSKYMLCGRTDRGFNHVVICEGTSFLHDPHADNTFINGPCDDGYYWLNLLIPIL